MRPRLHLASLGRDPLVRDPGPGRSRDRGLVCRLRRCTHTGRGRRDDRLRLLQRRAREHDARRDAVARRNACRRSSRPGRAAAAEERHPTLPRPDHRLPEGWPNHRGGGMTNPIPLERFPLHLGLGARAVAQPEFTGMEWYASYVERNAADGNEGRLVSLYSFSESWTSWERHPVG